MVAAATVVVCTLYIYSAVCMMLRIAILIAGWLSCHRPLWCMTASVHSPRVLTIFLCVDGWLIVRMPVTGAPPPVLLYLAFSIVHFIHFLHVTYYVSLYQILLFNLSSSSSYIHILCEVCLRCVTCGQVLLLELSRKAILKYFFGYYTICICIQCSNNMLDAFYF